MRQASFLSTKLSNMTVVKYLFYLLFALPERLHKVQIRELVQLHECVQHLDVELIPVDQRNEADRKLA